MGESGVDIQDYSDTLPISIECKAVEKLNIWDALAQAEENTPLLKYPCVVFKRNHSDTFATVRWDYLLWLLKRDLKYKIIERQLEASLNQGKNEIATWNDQRIKEG